MSKAPVVFRFEVVGARGTVQDRDALRTAWGAFVEAVDGDTPEGEFPLTGAISGSSDLGEALTIHAADTRPEADAEAPLEP